MGHAPAVDISVPAAPAKAPGHHLEPGSAGGNKDKKLKELRRQDRQAKRQKKADDKAQAKAEKAQAKAEKRARKEAKRARKASEAAA